MQRKSTNFRGKVLWYCIRRLQRSQIPPTSSSRARLSFSRSELDSLHHRTPRANNAGEALCGRLLCEVTRGATGVNAVRLEMPVDMRRVVPAARFLGTGDYTGNAVHVVAAKGTVRPAIVEESPSSPSAEEVTNAFVREIQDLKTRLRNENESTCIVADWLEWSQFLDEGILVNPRPSKIIREDADTLTLVVNSHRRLAGNTTLVPGTELFGPAAGACVRFLPGQSDAVQLLPGVGDNEGGIDVFLSLPFALRSQAERSGQSLESEEFRERVLWGCRGNG